MTSNQVKVGIVGLGKMGLFHLAVLKKCPNVEVVGLADPNRVARMMVDGMNLSLPLFEDVGALLATKKPDLVFACVPPAYNYATAKACLEVGVGVFLEKPFSVDLPKAKETFALLQNKSMANAVGFMVLYNPTFVKAKQLLDQAWIGSVQHYTGSVLLGEVFSPQTGWRQNPAVSGGGCVSIVGSHLLCLMDAWFGRPTSVDARLVKLYSSVEDIATARFDHASGLSGYFYSSWSQPGYNDMEIRLFVQGAKGAIEATDSMVSLFLHEKTDQFEAGWHRWHLWDLPSESSGPNSFDFGRPGYLAQDLDVVEAFLQKRPVRASWETGLNVQTMIEAIYRSHAANQPIQLNDLHSSR